MTQPTNSRNTPAQVAKFYDEHTSRYLQAGEAIIQSMRPDDATEFLEYLQASIGLKDGMRILDAGCGLAGPAVYFAQRWNIDIDCLTISAVECAAASTRVMEAGLSDKVVVRQGDFHAMDQLYSAASFDAVIFLESLGHAANPARVLEAARRLLKSSGSIYIKDFFPRGGGHTAEASTLSSIVASIDRTYCYNTAQLDELLAMLTKARLNVVSMNAPAFVPSRAYLESFERLLDCPFDISPIEWLEIKCVK